MDENRTTRPIKYDIPDDIDEKINTLIFPKYRKKVRKEINNLFDPTKESIDLIINRYMNYSKLFKSVNGNVWHTTLSCSYLRNTRRYSEVNYIVNRYNLCSRCGKRIYPDNTFMICCILCLVVLSVFIIAGIATGWR